MEGKNRTVQIYGSPAESRNTVECNSEYSAKALHDFLWCFIAFHHSTLGTRTAHMYRGADKSLARSGLKQATATEDFEFHISYL